MPQQAHRWEAEAELVSTTEAHARLHAVVVDAGADSAALLERAGVGVGRQGSGGSDAISPKLTPRERDVVSGLRAGKTYKAIAHELGIAESTARVLGSKALRKSKRTRMQIILV